MFHTQMRRDFSRIMKTKILFLLFLAAATIPARAITISQWTFETGVQTPASVDPNATASSFTLSSGGVTFPSGNAPTATTAISGTGWNVADGVKWWQFTVTANAGYQLDLTSLTFDDQRSPTGPASWSVTVNGVTAVSGLGTHAAFAANPMNTVSLSGLAFQDLGSAVVKIFGFGASAPVGTWRLDNVNLNGTVAQNPAVPDAGTTALLLSIPLLGLFALRRFTTRAA